MILKLTGAPGIRRYGFFLTSLFFLCLAGGATDVVQAAKEPGASEVSLASEKTINTENSSITLAVLDADTPWPDLLASGADPGVSVYLAEDGVPDPVAAVLAGTEGPVQALHIVSHGRPGALTIDGKVLDGQALSAMGRTWAPHLAPGATILLYGCSAGQGSDGRSLVAALARATGARVVASSTPTGAAGLGGDWRFDVSSDRAGAETASAFSAVHGRWPGLLAGSVNITTTAGDTSAGSIRAAAGDPTDYQTFVFSNLGSGQTINLAGNLDFTHGAAVVLQFSGTTTSLTMGGSTITADSHLYFQLNNSAYAVTLNSDLNLAGATSIFLVQGGTATFNGNFISLPTLQITNSGTAVLGTATSAGKIDINTGGTLRFSTDAAYTSNIEIENTATFDTAGHNVSFSGAVTDDGTNALVKTGAGTLTLSGTNTASGTVTVNQGTLSIATDGNLSSGALTLNGGTLAVTGATTIDNAVVLGASHGTFNTGAAITFSGVISGAGNLTKTGAGTLTLSGTNTYAGTTTVNAGTLAIASDSNLGSGSLALSGGNLSVNNSGATDIDNAISGTGSLTKTGAGTLTLSGTNTYAGTTTVNAGTLAIASDSNLGSGSLALSGGNLSVNNSGATDIDNAISGTGSLTKTGTGTLTLSGANTYSGATTVSAGTLTVNGSIANSSLVTINSGGTLGGTGTLGTATINSGGIHAPGNSIGTQTVTGNYTLGNGAVLVIEVDTAGNADQVSVTGTVNVTGSTLRILGLPDNNISGQAAYTHIIIANDGVDAVVGTFNTVDNQLAFYDATVSTTGGTGNDVTLVLARKAGGFTDIASTDNQRAVAAVLSSLPGTDGTAVQNAILGLSTQGARQAYNQLSGDVHAAGTSLNTRITGQAGGQVNNRLTALRVGRPDGSRLAAAAGLSPAAMAGFAPDGPEAAPLMASAAGRGATASAGVSRYPDLSGSAVWLQGLGGRGSIDGDGNVDNTDYKWAGMMGGIDTPLSDKASVGLYLGYVDGQSRQDVRDATLDSADLLIGVYGTRDFGANWSLSGRLGWARIQVDSTRNLNFGSISRTAAADYTDQAVNAEIELARGVELSGRWRLEPYLGMGADWNRYGSFSETGAGSSNLSRDSDSDFTGTTSLGLRAAGLFALESGKTLILRSGLGWRHLIGPSATSSSMFFSGTPLFTVSGPRRDRNTLVGTLGVALAEGRGWSFYADYQPSLSENRMEHAVSVGIRLAL